eukprot:313257_1
MKLMQEQLKINPRNSENLQFMMQMLHIYASSQQNAISGTPVSISPATFSPPPAPAPLHEDKEMEPKQNNNMNDVNMMEIEEQKSKAPLQDTIDDTLNGEDGDDEKESFDDSLQSASDSKRKNNKKKKRKKSSINSIYSDEETALIKEKE